MVCDNFGQFGLHKFGITGLAAETTEDFCCTVDLPTLDEVAGRFWEKEKAECENKSPEHLYGDGDAVGASVGVVLGTVVNARREKDTNGDTELVAGNDSTTDLFGCDLRHVKNDDGRDEADPKPGNKTTSYKQSIGMGAGLEANADDEDATTDDDGSPTTGKVGDITGHKSTKEGTGREDGDNERLLPGRESEASFVGAALGIFGVIGILAGVEVDEKVHAQDAIDVARVIAEEDTSKGSKGTHKIGFDGDGGLNAASVRRSDQARSARHDEGGPVISSDIGIWAVDEMVLLEYLGWFKEGEEE